MNLLQRDTEEDHGQFHGGKKNKSFFAEGIIQFGQCIEKGLSSDSL